MFHIVTFFVSQSKIVSQSLGSIVINSLHSQPEKLFLHVGTFDIFAFVPLELSLWLYRANLPIHFALILCLNGWISSILVACGFSKHIHINRTFCLAEGFHIHQLPVTCCEILESSKFVYMNGYINMFSVRCLENTDSFFALSLLDHLLIAPFLHFRLTLPPN